MIAFGCSILSPDVYRRYAGPGLRRAAESDSVCFAVSAAGSIARTYNLLLEQASRLPGLEALVLVHEDAEIVDPAFADKLRDAFRDPDVGVVGCVGAIGARSLAWWEGSATWGAFVERYEESRGTGVPALTWNAAGLPSETRVGEVDVVDGFMLALAPWTVRNMMFDESLGQAVHGHDVDLCLQVRASGRKVVVVDLDVRHHHSVVLVTEPEGWIEGHMALAAKWEPEDDDWRLRARRAEAEAGAARLQGTSKLLEAYARAEVQERDLAAVTSSISWRLTEPLRRLNARRRGLHRRQR